MKINFLKPALLLIFLLNFTLAFAQNAFPTKQLDDKLEVLLKETHAPGFSIAIVKNNQVIYSKGFGYSNIAQKQKVDENTLFAIGSTTKAFTTGLLGIMEAEHGLNFDDNPRKYLPKLEFYNDQLDAELTIKDLVAHRSGLPRHDMSWYLFPTENRDSLLTRIKYHEPFKDIRTQWYYNNFGYLIQGMITEKITGKSWEDNIRERFFIPLEMKNSNLSFAEMKQAKNMATGYEWKNMETTKAMDYYNIAAMSPAGSINSSALEMTKWIGIWLNKGKYKDKQVLPEAYVKKAINPLFIINGIADPKFPDQHLNSYGYAWFVSSYKGHYRMDHGGNIDGFSANVSLFPNDDIGIVVLTNQNGSMLPVLARNIAADLLLATKATDWIAYLKEKQTANKKKLTETKTEAANAKVNGTKPSHSLQEFTGDYKHPGYGTFYITVKNDSLFAQTPKGELYLSHRHYDIFTPMEVKNNVVDTDTEEHSGFNFQTDDAGKIVALTIKLEPTLEPIKFTKTTAIAAPKTK